MTAIAFDTLKFVQTLRHSGLANRQAEALAEAVRGANTSADLCTKGDVELFYAKT